MTKLTIAIAIIQDQKVGFGYIIQVVFQCIILK